MRFVLVSVFIRGAFTEGLSDVDRELESVSTVGEHWFLFFLVCVCIVDL